MTQVPAPDLTVVLAAVDAEGHVNTALAALIRGCEGVRTEILVVGVVAADVRHSTPEVTVLAVRASGLTPELWADGIRRATGRVVALTTTHFSVAPGWGRALVQAITANTAAAGGPMTLA